jgi:hypothetical protein
MWWKLFQLSIVVAVIFSDIHYDWGHGGSKLAVAVVAIFAAWVATASIFAVMDLTLKLKALLLRRQQRIKRRSLSGR